jgi:tRNA pseudouridine38-40 synthase
MREAAALFIGMRDFQSFAEEDEDRAGHPSRSREAKVAGAARKTERSTLVLVERLDVIESDDLVLVGIEGSHFLWKMVRRIVGVLVEIGRGGLEPAAAATFLAESSDAPARLTAPASGLFLEHVWYERESRHSPVRAVTPVGHAGSRRMPSTSRTTSA